MKYSYNWLKDLSGTKLSAEKIADAITMRAFEVEEIENVGWDFANVIVGEILEIEKHPNADRLQLTKINIGKEKLQIVCGAHNIKVGDKVPVALVGANLPNGLEIRSAEIRGVSSFGMLCAPDELGLGTDHSGILILDKTLKIGTPVSKVLSGPDNIFEIKILPDRAHDALSHVGLAREIAAVSGSEIDYAYDELLLEKKKTKKVSVKIEDPELCSRYIAGVLLDVSVQQSPEWLKTRLERCGIRSINNVVDVTNYVMLELGQPLHAFDGDQIPADITVRRANKNEKLIILDGTTKELVIDDIVISGGKNAIALAGVMGGQSSGVTQDTTTVVLEAATFNPAMIRKTKNRLNLLTDAAQRFEKGIDPNLAEKAMVRAIELLQHIADAQFDGIVDVYPKKKNPWTISLDLEYADKLLGERVPEKVSKNILTSLGFKIKGSGRKCVVTVPTYRMDALTQEDLIEEIGRIYGYEKIKPIAPLAPVQTPRLDDSKIFSRGLKNILVSQGFSEVYNYAFYGQKEANLIGLGSLKHLELESPLSPEQALVRVSLIPNILKNVHANLKNYDSFGIFEIGRVFWPNGGVLPEEKNMLVGAVVSGQKNKKNQKDKRQESPFFAAKAHVDNMMAQLGITDHYFDNFNGSPLDTPTSVWHESRCAQIKIEGHEKAVGYIGEINPFVLTNVDIHTRAAMFEFDVEMLREVSSAEREFLPLRKYPVVERDISMVVGGDIRVDDILEMMQLAGGNLVLDVDLFDIFDFADNTSSFAFHIMLGADDRTLTSKEIYETMSKITQRLEEDSRINIRK